MKPVPRFWWTLRDWWHYPQFWHMAPRYPIPWHKLQWAVEYPKLRKAMLKGFLRDLKWRGRMFYWELRYLQPFRCNGDKGGWRTKVCNWLEEKARSYEKEE